MAGKSAQTASSRQPFDLVAETARAFSSAAERAGDVVQRSFMVAGCGVRLRFAGPALVDAITRALSHPPPCEEEPELVIEVWDSASTSAGEPPPLPGCPEGTPEGVRILYHEKAVQAVYLPAERRLSMVDSSSGRAWFWTADAAEMPHWERAAPLRYVLNGWFGPRGHHLLHAGAVADMGAGLLVVGKGGSGKSTTALTCVQAGFSYTGDDYSLVTTQPPTAHPLYSSGKLHAPHVMRFPQLLHAVENKKHLDEEKAVMFVDSHASDLLQGSFPIRAVAVPRVAGRPETSFASAPAAEALMALAPSTVFLMPGSSETQMSAMAELLSQTPCYRLELGTDLATIPGVVRELLGDAARNV